MVSKYFVGILNLWISIPTKYMKTKCPTNKNNFTVIVVKSINPFHLWSPPYNNGTYIFESSSTICFY